MRQAWSVVLVVSLLSIAGAAQAASREFTQWLPGESFAGGKQEDARLDRPVQCWRAGLSLEAVFQEIARQTGVKLAFEPGDDENRRVRVHVFLNEKQPPSLREVMVQLAWVLDCSFSVAEEEGGKTYYLMGTSIGRAAPEALRAHHEQVLRDMAAMKQAIRDRIAGLEDALKLSRDEAIRRYRGSDDRMLLDLLDPAKRGALLLTARYTFPGLDENRFTPEDDWLNTGPSLQQLTPEERAGLQAGFGPGEIDPHVFGEVTIHIEIGGLVQLRSPRHLVDGHLVPVGGFKPAMPTLLDMRPGAMLSPDEEVLLRRLLGEQMTPQAEQECRSRREYELAAAKDAQQVKQSGASLSPQMADLLAHAELAVPAGQALWSGRLAEEVARATGLHVLCDGLLWASVAPAAEPEGKVHALGALEALCSQKSGPDLRDPGWEWGDAGRFLRFRTANRDVWRAALLPVITRDWLDGQLRPVLPSPALRATRAQATLRPDPAAWMRQLAGLSELQARYASRVLDGDPRDLMEPARRALWGAATANAQMRSVLLRLLGSLSDEQWSQARQASLKWPGGMTPAQYELLQKVLVERNPTLLPPEGITSFTVALDSLDAGGPASVMELNDSHGAAWISTVAGDAAASAAGGAWHRVEVKALRKGEGEAPEVVAFDRKEAFLPKVVHLQVETAE